MNHSILPFSSLPTSHFINPPLFIHRRHEHAYLLCLSCQTTHSFSFLLLPTLPIFITYSPSKRLYSSILHCSYLSFHFIHQPFTISPFTCLPFHFIYQPYDHHSITQKTFVFSVSTDPFYTLSSCNHSIISSHPTPFFLFFLFTQCGIVQHLRIPNN